MHFWNIEALKKELYDGTLSEKEKFVYVFVLLIYGIIFREVYLAGAMPHYTLSLADWIEVFLNIGVAVIGLIGAYYANGGIDGERFLERLFSIGFLAYMRVMIIYFVITALYLLFNVSVVGSSTMVYIFYYWYIGKHIGDLRSGDIVDARHERPSFGMFCIMTLIVLSPMPISLFLYLTQ